MRWGALPEDGIVVLCPVLPVDKTWDGNEEVLFPHVEDSKIISYAAGLLSVETINTAIGDGSKLIVSGPMNDSDLAAIKEWLDGQ